VIPALPRAHQRRSRRVREIDHREFTAFAGWFEQARCARRDDASCAGTRSAYRDGGVANSGLAHQGRNTQSASLRGW